MDLTATLKLNIAELLWTLRYTRFSGAKERSISERLLTEGYFVEENFLSESTVDRLVAEALQVLKDKPELVFAEGGDERVYGIDRLSRIFHLEREMTLPNHIEKKFELGWNRDWFQLFGRVTAVPGNLGSGAGWHRDSPYRHQFKALIYLTDVLSEDNGPFEFVPRSHLKSSIGELTQSLGVSPSLYRFTEEQVAGAQAAGVIPKPNAILGRKGTMVMVDTRGLHRGRPLKEGSRMAITRYYFRGKKPWYWKKFPLLQMQPSFT